MATTAAPTSVLRLAERAGYQVREERVAIDEWGRGCQDGRFVEAFATGTAAVVQPLVQVVSDSGGWPASTHARTCVTWLHIVGRWVRLLAEHRSSPYFTIDLDPRWMKRLIATARPDLAGLCGKSLDDFLSDPKTILRGSIA